MTTTTVAEDTRRRHLPRLPPIGPSADPIPLVRALLTASETTNKGGTEHIFLSPYAQSSWLVALSP